MSEWRQAFDSLRAGEELKDRTRKRAAGAERELRRVSNRARRLVLTAVAAVLVFALAAGGFHHYTITAEAAYVSVEADGVPFADREEPQIGLSVNRFGIVIAVEGLNEAGAEVMAQVDPIGKSYEEALEEVFIRASALGYLADEARVDFSVCAVSDDELAQSLQKESQNVVDAVCPHVSSVCGWISSQTRAAAAPTGMSCNRYRLAEAIMALDQAVTLDDCSSYRLCELECWYQALLEGRSVMPEEVPELCEEYGSGAGCGSGCPAWDGNGGSGYESGHRHGHGNFDPSGYGSEDAYTVEDTVQAESEPGIESRNETVCEDGGGYGHHGHGGGCR
ncbi:MAG: hypothetical protein HFI93_06585 [Lachnospiraceae bacterium]|nr:hypothetical protein [Lachnospiraceae bacterium]